MKYFLSIFLLLGLMGNGMAQAVKDSVSSKKDSVPKRVKPPTVKKPDSSKAKLPAVKKPDTSRNKSIIVKRADSLLKKITVGRPDTSRQKKLIIKTTDSLGKTIVRKPDTSHIKKQVVKKPDSSISKAVTTVKPETSRIKLRPISISDTSIKKSLVLKPDSIKTARKDSVMVKTPRHAVIIQRPQVGWAKMNAILKTHPYFNFFGPPRYEVIIKRPDAGKEGLFYLLTGVVMYFALVRLLFGKYMTNLFSLFFRVSLKQKQIREQLLQSPLPSLLLNIFFIISGGIYISFLLKYYKFGGTDNLWFLMLNSVIALGLVYLTKYLILKITGWIFNISEATDTYAFVVFLVNKLLGILLIPFLVLLAFSAADLISVLITLSFTVIAIFFVYRYIISYAPVRKEIKVTQFHFLLYLCAFEIIPLLLIYKVLLTFLEKSS